MAGKGRAGAKRSTGRSSLEAVLKGIRLFATDVDGVMTDAGMYYSDSGEELKKFNTRDGMGIKLLQEGGLVTGFITKEKTSIVERRAAKLAVPEVHLGADDKVAVLRMLSDKYEIPLGSMAYMGDDIIDLEALKAVGFSAAPADAMPPILKVVTYVCRKRGGEGAVREVADMILAAKARGSVNR